MDSSKIVTATFSTANTRDLTINITGAGTVSRSPAGTSCGTNCWTYGEGMLTEK